MGDGFSPVRIVEFKQVRDSLSGELEDVDKRIIVGPLDLTCDPNGFQAPPRLAKHPRTGSKPPNKKYTLRFHGAQRSGGLMENQLELRD